MGIGRHVDLRDLAERIRSIEERHSAAAASRYLDDDAPDCIPTGWAEIDTTLCGGLPVGGLHEWFGVEQGRRWTPPLCILVHLAWRAMERHSSHPWAVWVGRRCHPYPRVLIRDNDRRLLERSLFIAPREAASRLWVIDLALRSPAVGCIIADGSGFDRAATQRIQLLARTQSKPVFCACPTRQQSELSAAQTRWCICAAPLAVKKNTSGISPRWSIELLRCKGMRPAQKQPKWLLEWNRAESAVHLSARLADLAGQSEKDLRRSEPVRLQQRTA